VRRYLFSTDHRIVGLQYFWLSLIAVLIGIGLSMLMRFHLVFPAAKVGFLQRLWPNGAPDGVMTPELYLSLMTMHGTIMVFFVLSVAPQSAFGNCFLPLQIGARNMAFPILSGTSFWLTLVAFLILLAAFFVPGGAPLSGWTAYPPLSALGAISGPGQGAGQTLWIVSIAVFCLASILGAINFIATTLDLRRPGLGMMSLPLTCWSWFVTSILILLGFAVLLAAGTLLLLDRCCGTSFFVPGGLLVNDRVIMHKGGSPLLWQHLFWFFGHPEVYIAILPGMGLVSEVLSTFSRKPIFGRRAMIVALFAIGFLGLLVWGHHMFTSGMSPYSSLAFSVLTMTIGVPSAIKTFNWLATLWGGKIELTTAMLFALGFVSIFVTGGLSGIFLGQPVLDLYFHDTYFVVAHFHLVMGVAAIFGIFAATFYWFPLMFGRMLDETVGKIHFFATLAGAYALFLPMHLAGIAGNPRRYSDFTNFEFLSSLMPLHQFMTGAAFFTAWAQTLFVGNVLWTLWRGRRAPSDPWHAETLEWKSPVIGSESKQLPRAAVTGLMAALAAITMLFAAFASAYVVRRGIADDWTHLQLPWLLYASLPLLISVSIVLEAGRRSNRNLSGAAVLGVLFVLAQLYIWRQLGNAGISLSTHPAGAFFYVLSGAFLVHVLGGVLGLLYVGMRAPGVRIVSYYWHFLTGLWIALLVLFNYLG
jgi:cytochrome c oxidase subunit 1